MDGNENENVYSIEFDAQIGKGFSSTIGKVKREIGKIPEERTLRFSAKTNFKHLDNDLKGSLKNFEKLQNKMTGKNIFGLPKLRANIKNALFGDRNRFKDIDRAFEKTRARAIAVRQEQYRSLQNLMGTQDINDNDFSDDSLMGQTNKAYGEQQQVILDLKDRLAELYEEREKLKNQKAELKLLPNEEKVVAQINNTITVIDKLRNKIEKYKKIDIGGEQAQKQINDISERIYAKTEQLTRVAIGHANRTGTDTLYRTLRETISNNMKQQQEQMRGLNTDLDKANSEYAYYADIIRKLETERPKELGDLNAEEQAELDDAKIAIEELDEKLNELETRKNKVNIYVDVNKKQLDNMAALWKQRATINPVDEKPYNKNNAENYFAAQSSYLATMQDTLSNRVTGTVSTEFINRLENQLEAARQKKLELDDVMANEVPINESDITEVAQKIEQIENEMKEIQNQSKLANDTSGKLQKRWDILNQELGELRHQWQLLNQDMSANPMTDNFMADGMQGVNGIWDTLNAKIKRTSGLLKGNNVLTRLWRRILTQIRNTIAGLINPLNLWNKGWNSWLDRIENKQLKNTFEMIKYNLVTAFEPLFKKFAQFLLKLTQIANIFTKKFVGVDLFDSTDWKKNKAMIDQLTASFDELHANGENTDTIFDSGTFEMEPLSDDQVKFWEDMADKVKAAWEGVQHVFQWIIDNWKWLVAAWAAYKIGRGLLGLLGWGKDFGGLLKGLSLGNLLTGLGLAISAALMLQGIFEDVKLSKQWNQMNDEERNKTADKGDAFLGIGGALGGGIIGAKMGASALGASMGLTAATGMAVGATVVGGIALGISSAGNAITAASRGDFELVEKESKKSGVGFGAAAGAAIGTAICPGIGTAIGAGVGALVGFIGGTVVGKISTFFGDMGGDFSKLKVTADDLTWATNQYNAALSDEYNALTSLKQAEQLAGMSGESLYNMIQNGTLQVSNLTTEQKVLYKTYENYKQAIENTSAALKQQTDYENAALKQKAIESKDFSQFINAMYDAHNKGIYSSEELQDRLSQVYSQLSKDEREIFLSRMPEDMQQGVIDGAEKYYSGWEKFKIDAGKNWEDFKEGWGNFWNGLGNRLNTANENMKTIASNIWNGMKTTAGNVWNSMKIEAIDAWDKIKDSAIGQKVQEIATNVNQKWEEIKAKTGEKWNNIKETVGGKVEELKNNIQTKWENIKTTANNTWDNIKNNANDKWQQIKDSAIGQKVQNIINSTKSKFEEMKNNLTNSWNTLKNNASTAWTNIKNSIVNGAKQAWEGAKGFFSKIGEGVKNAWDSIKGFVQNTGEKFGNFFSGKGFKTNTEYEELKKRHPEYASLDIGTNYVPNDGLAYIHKGEAVVPAKYNKPYMPNNNYNLESTINRLVDTVNQISNEITKGIPVNGQFIQKGDDLVATVQRATNRVSNNILSQKQYAR